MILGLDVSTSITGVSVINRKGDILLCEAIDTRNKNKFPSLLSKASFIKSKLREIKNAHKIDEIYIEESLAIIQVRLLFCKNTLDIIKNKWYSKLPCLGYL